MTEAGGVEGGHRIGESVVFCVLGTGLVAVNAAPDLQDTRHDQAAWSKEKRRRRGFCAFFVLREQKNSVCC